MGLLSRLPRLPPRDPNNKRISSPIKAIRDLTIVEQTLFWSGLFAWLSDYNLQPTTFFAFLSLSFGTTHVASLGKWLLNQSDSLQAQFSQSTHAITTAITLTLLLRPFGAIFFGLLSDRFGRKWPLVTCLMVISGLQIGTGFVTTFHQFLAVRSLFGIAMGGVWGLASAASIESMPVGSRGLYSGLMQVGYPGGYLIASVVNLFLVPETPQTWRSIYWVGAGMSAAAATFRSILPESAVFVRSKKAARQVGMSSSQKTRVFFRSLRRMLRTEWLIWIYGVVLLSGLNFLAHGSQDLYTTFMQNSKGFSASLSTKANIIGEVGAVVGATLGGVVSQFLGRRMTLVLACLWCCAFIPLWIIPNTWSALSLGAFFFQGGVNIAWGTVAIYLNELAPPAFRGLYPGTVYQIGNAASAAAAQIEATAGLSIRTQVRGVDQPDYGKIQAIVAAASCSLILLCALFGPENHSARFEDERTAIEEDIPTDFAAAENLKGKTSEEETSSG